MKYEKANTLLDINCNLGSTFKIICSLMSSLELGLCDSLVIQLQLPIQQISFLPGVGGGDSILFAHQIFISHRVGEM